LPAGAGGPISRVMGQLRRVLCAVELDASGLPALGDAAEVVLRAGDREARLHGAELVVLHALPMDAGAPMSPAALEQSLFQRAEVSSAVIDAVLAGIQRLTGRDPEQVQVEVADGPPERAILQAADDTGADLVVVGSTGARGLRRLFLGSVASDVVRHGHTSVLVARPAPETGWVLLAVDFTPASQAAAEVAAEEARRRGARLCVLHSMELVSPEAMLAEPGVIPSPALMVTPTDDLVDAGRRRLTDFLARLSIEAESEVVVGPPADSIVSAARDRGVELVVVGTSNKSGIDRLLLGSVAATVVRDAPCPVLVVRPRDAREERPRRAPPTPPTTQAAPL
jgi:nucleotide-binding universal stress UspA family protein